MPSNLSTQTLNQQILDARLKQPCGAATVVPILQMHLQRLKRSFVQEVEPECEPDLYDLPGLPVSRYCLKSPPCQALSHAVVWGHNRHHPSCRIYTQCCSGTPSGVASLWKRGQGCCCWWWFCSPSPHSAYLDPHPLVTRTPCPGLHLESDPNSPSHFTLRATFWDMNP